MPCKTGYGKGKSDTMKKKMSYKKRATPKTYRKSTGRKR